MKKDLNWFKEQLDDIEMNTPRLWSHNSIWMLDRVNELLNQLDDPEVLSQDWITENSVEGDFRGVQEFWYGEFIEKERVQNLLVQKQEEVTQEQVQKYLSEHGIEVVEKPVIPAFVADWIEEIHERNTMIELDHLNDSLSSQNMKKEHKLYFWIKENFDTFARAWLDGFTVEKDQKYILSINITDKASKTNYETFLNKRGIFHSMENESFNSEEFNWTEEEIKDLESGEILFEHFATKVEVLEE